MAGAPAPLALVVAEVLGADPVEVRGGSRRRAVPLALLAVALATGAALVLLLAPLGARVSVSVDGTGEETRVEERTRMIDTEGAGVVAVLGAPVVVAAVGTWLGAARRSRRPLGVAAAVLWAFVVLGLLSVGAFYLPAAAAMTVAAIRR